MRRHTGKSHRALADAIRVRRQMAAAIVVLVAFVAAELAFGSDSSSVPHHLHAPRLARGPAPQLMKQGTILSGGSMFSHSKGGSSEGVVASEGAAQTIYTGTEAWEPTLGIDEKGNIFYQAQGRIRSQTPATDISQRVPMVVVSRDGGKSWDDITPDAHVYSQDPFLYVDPGTGRTFTADFLGCLTVSHTDDVGESWMTSEACGLTDHQNLFAGPPVSSPTVGYPNVVYICAADGGATADFSTATSCLKSLDGGSVWVRTGAPAYTSDPRLEGGNRGIPGLCDGGTGHGVVDSKGYVYLPRALCGQPFLAISRDEGATWERVQVADTGMPQHLSGVFEHEAAVAVDAQGNIYYFWMAVDRLPYLAVSTDQGRSFSEPIMVGPPDLKEAWGPTIAVGDVGKVALAYVGSTNAPGGDAPMGVGEEYDNSVTWNGYITTSIEALANQPLFLSASVNAPEDPIMRGECGAIRCGEQGDFIDVAIAPDGRPWTSMVDACPPPGDPCVFAGQGFVGTLLGGPRLR